MKHSQPERRKGVSTIELAATLVASATLMLGLASALVVSTRSSGVGATSSSLRRNACAAVAQMQAELQYALTIPERGARSVTATVPDRDDPDSTAETIRYDWSGVAGAQLTRQYNGGTATAVAEGVTEFAVRYHTRGSVLRYISVRLRLGSDSSTAVEAAFPLVNQR
jgi:hypothetical protein